MRCYVGNRKFLFSTLHMLRVQPAIISLFVFCYFSFAVRMYRLVDGCKSRCDRSKRKSSTSVMNRFVLNWQLLLLATFSFFVFCFWISWINSVLFSILFRFWFFVSQCHSTEVIVQSLEILHWLSSADEKCQYHRTRTDNMLCAWWVAEFHAHNQRWWDKANKCSASSERRCIVPKIYACCKRYGRGWWNIE